MDYFKANINDIQILILGHSHAEDGISAGMFRYHCFNMAMGGQGLAIDEFIVETYIDDLPSLKFLIYPLSYHSLIAPEAYGGDDRITYFKIYYGYKQELFCEKDYELLARGMEKLKRHWNLIPERKKNDTTNNNYQNYAKEITDWYNSMEIDSLNRDRLEHIVRLCADRDIKVVLVTMPTMTDYQKLLDSTRLKMMYSAANYLTDKYNNVSYFDFSNDVMCQDTVYFHDESHLNRIGADFFSQKLAQALDSLEILP
ncbi:MAG: hypothetical protein LBR66_08005 [Candidatus Symbiothrix sp.]|nr:hypothetical protein [Candidatus Symbiothrix sp.]